MAGESAPSAPARALAAQMRDFDPALSDADIATIAARIDEQRALGRFLSPKKKRLANDVEPLTSVRAPDESA